MSASHEGRASTSTRSQLINHNSKSQLKPSTISETKLLMVWVVISEIIIQHFPQVTDEDSERLSAFISKNSYVRGRYDDNSSFGQLNAHLSALPGGSDANRLFYLALPPTVYHHVSTNIRAHCMSRKSVSVILTWITHKSTKQMI